MEPERLPAKLLEIFLGELGERLTALDQDLLALERTDDPPAQADLLQALFRTAHSLKGAANSARAPEIETVCHRLEEQFDRARRGDIPIDPAFLQAAFAAADDIRAASRRFRDSTGQDATPTPSPSPSPAPSGAKAPAPRRAAIAADRQTIDPVARIPAEKLDALLVKSGELLIARARARSRTDEAASLAESLQHLRAGFPALLKQLQSPARATGQAMEARRRIQATETAAAMGEALQRLDTDLKQLAAAMAEDAIQLERSAGPLDHEIRRIRMLPFAEACAGLDRLVRDLARATGKLVELVIEGGQIEIDRSVLDGLRDPLLHLVRNAIDHGIEIPATRRAAGKPPAGKIIVAASLRGTAIELVIADDGGGLDMSAIRAQAERRNLAPQDDDDLARLIFRPGFSTAPAITEISGRGVGLDVVLTQIEALRGTVTPSSTAGQGTRFTLSLPLTLTTVRGLLVGIGEQVFAIDVSNIVRLIEIDRSELRWVAEKRLLTLDGVSVSVMPLAELLGQPAQPEPQGPVSIVVLQSADERLAVMVDTLLTEQEIVIRDLGARLRRVRHIAGATLLATGRIVLILSVAELVRSGLAAGFHRRQIVPPAPPEPARRKHLLLADDSGTTRMLMRHILEAAGYDVTAAADGAEAWQKLEEGGADLVVSDIDMPHMDGFSLTEAIRQSSRFRNLPVILVTARVNDSDRLRGMQAGANAYLVKSAFDHRLLIDTVAQHV